MPRRRRRDRLGGRGTPPGGHSHELFADGARVSGGWETRRMSRVGLVLGGGGVVGQAYHSGVLAVLQHDFGLDARTADMIVGTSAGSITGTLLRLGVSAEDLAAWTVKAPLSGEGGGMRYLAETVVPDLAPFRLLSLLRRPLRLPGPHMLQRALARPLQFRPLAAGLALLPAGEHDILEQLAALREL